MGNIFTIRSYNLMEHQYMVGMLFKHFASIEDVSYDINDWNIVFHHDIVEVITQDLPYPVKNFSEKTKKSWDEIENELIKQHFQLSKYTDKNIKLSLAPRQYALMKACDILDLWIFVKEEQSYGNCSNDILDIEQNCLKIINTLEFDFPKIKKFMNNYG